MIDDPMEDLIDGREEEYDEPEEVDPLDEVLEEIEELEDLEKDLTENSNLKNHIGLSMRVRKKINALHDEHFTIPRLKKLGIIPEEE